jgi:hypothetical protein
MGAIDPQTMQSIVEIDDTTEFRDGRKLHAPLQCEDNVRRGGVGLFVDGGVSASRKASLKQEINSSR